VIIQEYEKLYYGMWECKLLNIAKKFVYFLVIGDLLLFSRQIKNVCPFGIQEVLTHVGKVARRLLLQSKNTLKSQKDMILGQI
jgi:hypothetical protein